MNIVAYRQSGMTAAIELKRKFTMFCKVIPDHITTCDKARTIYIYMYNELPLSCRPVVAPKEEESDLLLCLQLVQSYASKRYW